MADTDEMFERMGAKRVLAEARVVYLERQLKERDELVELLKRKAQNNIDRAFNRGVDAAFDVFTKERGITLTLAELDKLFRDVRYVDEFGDDTAKGDD